MTKEQIAHDLAVHCLDLSNFGWYENRKDIGHSDIARDVAKEYYELYEALLKTLKDPNDSTAK